MKAIIIAAGYGTRFLPVTKTIPKEMLPLVDKPSIDFILDEFEASGITDVLIVSSRRKKSLEDYLDREVELESVFDQQQAVSKLQKIKTRKLNLAFVRQQEMKGTGDALLTALPWIGHDPVIVAYPDDIHIGEEPLTLQLIKAHQQYQATILAVIENPPHLERYGVVAWEPGSHKIKDIVEKPALGKEPSKSASIGRYLYTPDFFDALKESYRNHQGGEFYHIGALKVLMNQGRVFGVKISGERRDTGDPLGYIEAFLHHALERKELRAETLKIMKILYEKYAESSE